MAESDEIRKLLAAGEPQRAIDILKTQLEKNTEDQSLWNLFAQAQNQNGDFEQAKQAYERCVKINPEACPDALLSLAQFYQGKNAEELYQRAIIVMVQMLEAQPEENMRRCVSDAYVAVAELYMTDLCDEENAEAQVQKSIASAKEHWSENISAILTEAQYFIIIGKFEKSKQLLRQAIDFMGEPDVLSEFDDYFRLVRLCLEIGDAETALGVVEGLIRARDDLAEAWALGAFGLFQLEKMDEGKDFLNTAKKMAKRTQDEGALMMIQELEANLEKLNSSQQKPKDVEKMDLTYDSSSIEKR